MSIATVQVDLHAILHNFALIQQRCPNSKVMAIIKANAYSHGSVEIALCLDKLASYFGVARLDEAIMLRQAGINSPIVILDGFFPNDDINDIYRYQLQPVIHNQEQISRLQNVVNMPAINVWFKLDTGMHRLGFRCDDAKANFMALAQCQSVKTPINVMSHFSCADITSAPTTLTQIALFDQFIDSIDDPSLIGEQSIAASGGILAWPQSHRDVVRCGISLYGVSPFAYDEPLRGTASDMGFLPAMVLKSELISIREHKQGEAVGYGQIWTSPTDTKLGVVAIGYGDGYPRDVKANTPVWINGRLVPIVGRVSMDMMVVDLGIDAQDKTGDDVILWGIPSLPVEKVAAHSEMLAYELVTRLTSRAKQHYIKSL